MVLQEGFLKSVGKNLAKVDSMVKSSIFRLGVWENCGIILESFVDLMWIQWDFMNISWEFMRDIHWDFMEDLMDSFHEIYLAVLWEFASGHGYIWKITVLIGKSTVNGSCSIANCWFTIRKLNSDGFQGIIWGFAAIPCKSLQALRVEQYRKWGDLTRTSCDLISDCDKQWRIAYNLFMVESLYGYTIW